VANDSAPVLAMTFGRRPQETPSNEALGRWCAGSVHTEFLRMGPIVLRPGDVELHAKAATGLSSRLLMITYNPREFVQVTGLQHWDAAKLSLCCNIASAPLSQLLRNIVRELETPRLGSDTALTALAQLSLVELARTFLQNLTQPRPAGLTTWQLQKIDRQLQAAEGHWPASEELAQLCGISSGHLSRSFRATTGRTLSSYMAEVRVNRAQRLLCESSLTLQQIAAHLGFQSPSSFSFAFRQAVGQTPKEYRQISRAEQAA
jgi:AraC family transcriptional regulator